MYSAESALVPLKLLTANVIASAVFEGKECRKIETIKYLFNINKTAI